MRTIPGMHEFIKPVDDVVRLELLPTSSNSIVPEVDRQLYSPSLRHGELGIPILSEIAESQFEASQAIKLSLVTIMITQGSTLLIKTEVNEIKCKITNEQEVGIPEQDLKVGQNQTPHTLKVIQDANIPGASLCLSVLPLEEFGFVLYKSEFKDALSLRYGKPLKGLPAMCPCGEKYNLTHALICKKGGFVTMCHNSLRGFEAYMLSKIVDDVEEEP